MFKHNLGLKAKARVSQLTGILTSRSECLYGCNRYFIQPPVGQDGKVPDGWWVDEDDVEIVGEGITTPPKNTGGPMSRSN
jgi:hypothetical protein